MFTTDAADAERFERFGLIADARSAATTRIEFAQRLRQFFELDTEPAGGGIHEALANNCQFAMCVVTDTHDVSGLIEFRFVVTVSHHGVACADGPAR